MIAAPLKMLRQHWGGQAAASENSFAFLLACGFCAAFGSPRNRWATPTVTIYYWTVLVICHLESSGGCAARMARGGDGGRPPCRRRRSLPTLQLEYSWTPYAESVGASTAC